MGGLDLRTPVVVGVGQASERVDDPGYRRLSAVDLAAESGLTLVGFLRGSSMNVYTGAHRLGLAEARA